MNILYEPVESIPVDFLDVFDISIFEDLLSASEFKRIRKEINHLKYTHISTMVTYQDDRLMPMNDIYLKIRK